MNDSLVYKLFWIPIFVIGVVLIILGPRWMLVEEPWLLDKVANEETLGISFDKLFSAEINNNLPDYLRTIYRFFGLWLTTIGVMFCSQTLVFDLREKRPRYTLLAITGVLLVFSLYLGHTRIPSSPFIYLMWGFVILYLVSSYGSWQLDRSSTNQESD